VLKGTDSRCGQKNFGKFYSGFKKSVRLDQAVLLKHYGTEILSSSDGYMVVRHWPIF